MRLGLVVRGTVQGVGFRPFVRRAALARGLTGFVLNGRDAVRIEVQGDPSSLEDFTLAIEHEHPPAAIVHQLDRERLEEQREEKDFAIVVSETNAPVAPLLPPDLAICSECAADVQRRGDRRYRYPFTNCVACGPRYTITGALPYDRPNTSMHAFPMCADCAYEYDDLNDRRYHAQPIACSRCGPALFFHDRFGPDQHRGEDALQRAIELLRAGGILAMRGLGGFQLLCDATNPRSVATLRERKRRPHKPFAAMFRDISQLVASTDLSRLELSVLSSPASPIVLVPRRAGGPVCELVAPDSPYVGAMLPNTPLHLLVLEGISTPVVCTSGNLSEEPICIGNDEALERLSSIADGFLLHDREIRRPVDDSVVRVSPRRQIVLRRARGYAPAAIGRVDVRAQVLALGAHAKSTVTIAHRGSLIPSQHLGDLDSAPSRGLLFATIDDLLAFFELRPKLLACDLHPDYASTIIAERLKELWGVPALRVQHHHAHVAACMAEHSVDVGDEVLGLAWDGAGAGLDGTIWGGEALACTGSRFVRRAHLRTFPLPGGDAASREPRRAALGLLFAFLPVGIEAWAARWFGDDAASHVRALELRINAPTCSSMGRLFDGIAALVGIDAPTTFEGQAAIRLEQLARTVGSDGAYPLPLREGPGGVLVADLAPLIHAVVTDLHLRVDAARIARRFHDALIDLGFAMAESTGIARVALTGGCFQNELLAEGLEARLERAGFNVIVPSALPPNDGGISVGQAWLASLDPRSWADP